MKRDEAARRGMRRRASRARCCRWRGQSGKSGESGEPDDPGPRHSAGSPHSPGFQVRQAPTRSRRGWSAWRALSAAAHRPPLASEATRGAGPSGVSCPTRERRRLGHSGATSDRSEAAAGPNRDGAGAAPSQSAGADREDPGESGKPEKPDTHPGTLRLNRFASLARLAVSPRRPQPESASMLRTGSSAKKIRIDVWSTDSNRDCSTNHVLTNSRIVVLAASRARSL